MLVTSAAFNQKHHINVDVRPGQIQKKVYIIVWQWRHTIMQLMCPKTQIHSKYFWGWTCRLDGIEGVLTWMKRWKKYRFHPMELCLDCVVEWFGNKLLQLNNSGCYECKADDNQESFTNPASTPIVRPSAVFERLTLFIGISGNSSDDEHIVCNIHTPRHKRAQPAQ